VEKVAVVVPIRFRGEDLKKIDELVKGGIFKSRSEAVRGLSLEAAERRYADFTKRGVDEAAESILEALKLGRNSLKIALKGKVAEFVAEGRERL